MLVSLDGVRLLAPNLGTESESVPPWPLAALIDAAAAELVGQRAPHPADRVRWSAPKHLDRPLALVCTNGRRDACCAKYGRPLANALAAASASGAVLADVWECTHLGGDRFAANLLVLPEGLLFGRVGAPDGPAILASLAMGVTPGEHLRGRTTQSMWEQAAEVLLRIAEPHLPSADRVRFSTTSRPTMENRLAEVVVTVDGASRRLHVQKVALGTAFPLSCGATDGSDPGLWRRVPHAPILPES